MIDNYRHSDITGLIIKSYYNVYNQLSYGFLEKVYQNAMLIELGKFELACIPQKPIDVFYDNIKVGFYLADIVVNDCVVVEIKASESLCEQHEAQLTNYLRATDVEVGILLNFGKKAEFKRKVFSKEYKILKDRPNHNNPRSIS
jgi:GxxExxY protein